MGARCDRAAPAKTPITLARVQRATVGGITFDTGTGFSLRGRSAGSRSEDVRQLDSLKLELRTTTH